MPSGIKAVATLEFVWGSYVWASILFVEVRAEVDKPSPFGEQGT
jgi:hypothetical protein